MWKSITERRHGSRNSRKLVISHPLSRAERNEGMYGHKLACLHSVQFLHSYSSGPLPTPLSRVGWVFLHQLDVTKTILQNNGTGRVKLEWGRGDGTEYGEE